MQSFTDILNTPHQTALGDDTTVNTRVITFLEGHRILILHATLASHSVCFYVIHLIRNANAALTGNRVLIRVLLMLP